MKHPAPVAGALQRQPAAAPRGDQPVSDGQGKAPSGLNALRGYIDQSARMTVQRQFIDEANGNAIQDQSPGRANGAIRQLRRDTQTSRPKNMPTRLEVPSTAPIQLRCSQGGQAWQANYVDSGLTVDQLFSNEDLKLGNSSNDENRGTFAHEYIQKKHGSWIPEYGIPAAVGHPGWSYADMVKDLKIYEIKPSGGLEDAVTQATNYVTKANLARSGHELATAAIAQRDCLLEKTLEVRDFITHRLEQDRIRLYLNYNSSRAGEIVYSWEIVNESREARKAKREKEKRDKLKSEKTAKENEKTKSAHHDLRSMFGAASKSRAEGGKSESSKSASSEDTLDAEANLLADQGIYHVAELREMRQTEQIRGMVAIIDELIEKSRDQPHGEFEPYFYYGRLRW